ncbi:hypothetical protein [Salinispira pacifica]
MKCILLVSAILSGSLFLIGCDASASSSGLDPIESAYDAELTVRSIIDGVVTRNVMSRLSNGTITAKVVSGMSGSATVDGYKSYTQSSCGTDCVSSTYDAQVTITFSDFAVQSSDNATTTITGSVYFKDHEYSRQYEYSFSSSRSYTIRSNSNIQYKMVVDNDWGYEETFTFSASGSNPYNPSGTLSTGKDSFSF